MKKTLSLLLLISSAMFAETVVLETAKDVATAEATAIAVQEVNKAITETAPSEENTTKEEVAE